MTQIAIEIGAFLLIILVTALIAHISKTLISTALHSSSSYLATRIQRYIFLLVWAVGIILAINQVGVSTDILLLLTALVAIGFFLSAYPVLQNFISRSFLSLQYKVGDTLSIEGLSGKVIEITDLNTVLLDEDGNLVSVPNVMFIKSIWTKYQPAGYELTLPVVIKKDIDTVAFETALLESIVNLKKYFKRSAAVVTSKTDDKTIELSLIMNLKDPEKKSLVTTEINEKVERLKVEFTHKAEEIKKEEKLNEIKDIGK
ncbi:MAG: mechanosensitive ion channel family protein [ANME-2 cluster archaeon]|nr:mechanosensitive ion channel family protein [ANME-2 cluster archaeon]